MTADVAQYGIAFFIVACITYVGGAWVKGWYSLKIGAPENNERADKAEHDRDELLKVIQNNTDVMKQLVNLMQSMEKTQARQGAQIEELLRKG